MTTDTETGFATLPDVPDFLNVETGESAPFEDGWYKGIFEASYQTTNRNGDTVTFESTDTPSRTGDSRNIRLRTAITRQSDSRTTHQGVNVNYRPGVDFAPERIAAIAEGKTRQLTKDEKRSQIAVSSFKELSLINGANLSRNGDGGFDLTPLFGKPAYFRWGAVKQQDGSTRPGIVDFSATAPKRGNVL